MSKSRIRNMKPPIIAKRILKYTLRQSDRHAILGDFEEAFKELGRSRGRWQARVWYWGQVLVSVPGIIQNRMIWRATMLWNYFKITWRNIKKQKGFSFINIAGLAVGMACCILIMLWVQDELSYDRFHENGDHIYRVVSEDRSGGEVTRSAGSPSPIGPTLVEKYPEIENFTRVQSGWSGWYLHYGDKNFMEERLACADPSFFDIFRFRFLQGDPKTALKERYSIVLTETLARKCFGNDDPMGKILQISDRDLTVTGVIEDIPHNSHLNFDYVFPIVNMTKWRESKLDDWQYDQFATYIVLNENSQWKNVNIKMSKIVTEYDPQSKVVVSLQPLKDIHLHSTNLNTWMVVYPNPGNVTYVYIFSLIAVCILLVACINFMNLSTARSSMRVKEVGIRKAAGADRYELIKQFLGETIVLSLLALTLAIFLVYLMLPFFHQLTGKALSLDSETNIQTLLGLLGIVLLTGVVAGSYPAFYLSGFQPVSVFRASTQFGMKRNGLLRKVLVVGQFMFTVILILVTAVIYGQLHFIQNMDLGFDKDNIIYFASYGEYGRNYEATKNILLQNPNVMSVCLAFPPSGSLRGTTEVSWEGKDPNTEIRMHSDMGDYDFIKTFGIRMALGRFYSREYSTDVDNFVVNETAVKVMDFEEPIGKEFTYEGRIGTIIGVAKDYHGGSLHHPILPKIIELSDDGFFICVKFRSGHTREMIRFFEEKWNEFVPNRPFRYRFLDESIDAFYQNERRIGKIFRYFTALAVAIACLGLFGLSSFMAERRTKEIGIRKVLGASVSGILLLLTKEFVKWVIIANLIAWPVAWFIMDKWLQNFAYRIPIGWWMFVLSGALALVIAMLTVSFQAVKAATANPVESLRYE